MISTPKFLFSACEACGGGGEARLPCPDCDETGKQETRRYKISVRIPHGVRHGDLLRGGSIDAVVTADPFMSRITDSGAGYVVTPLGADLLKRLSELQAFASKWSLSQAKTSAAKALPPKTPAK